MSTLVRSPQRSAASDFRARLEQIVQRRIGPEARLLGPGPWAHPYRSTAPLEVWCVTAAEVREVVVKRPSRRRVRPPFMREPDREHAVYAMILEPRDLGAPRLLGTIAEPGAEADALVLESVDGTPLWQVEDERVWAEAARWLAEFHGHYWDPPDAVVENVMLLIMDGAHHRRWIRRALDGVRGDTDDGGPSRSRQSAEWLAARWDEVIDRLRACPVSLLHGEFYPSNILVRSGRRIGSRICPVDWESAAVGACLIDLAALTTGWSTEVRTRLASAYLDVLRRRELWSPDQECFDELLDACRVQQAVQWSAWTTRWTPPPEHARDWWAEAVAIVEQRRW